MNLAFLSAVGMPLVMVIGAIAAWRMSRKSDQTEQDQSAWRDDSLDEWRRERDAAAEAERAARATGAAPELQTGKAEEQVETKRHQRIGG